MFLMTFASAPILVLLSMLALAFCLGHYAKEH